MSMNGLVLAFFESIGLSELLVIFLVILLLFGGKKLPELAKGLGKSIRIFKEEMHGVAGDASTKPADTNEKSDKPADTAAKDSVTPDKKS